MNFITDLLELNKYNIPYIVIDYNLIKTIVFILYIKTINVWGGATRVVKASLVFLCDYVTSCLIYLSKATIYVPPSIYRRIS